MLFLLVEVMCQLHVRKMCAASFLYDLYSLVIGVDGQGWSVRGQVPFSVPWTVPGQFSCGQHVRSTFCVCVTRESDYVPDRRFILVQWNVMFCTSFVVGVLQCAFDACLSGRNQRYGLQVFCGKCFDL